MKHQPYETWILLETKLTAEQRRELYQHTKTCSQCRRLAKSQREIAYLFSTTPTPYPAPGFTNRWKKRLTSVEEGKKKTAILITLSALSLAFILTFVGLSFQITSRSEYFPQIMTVVISQAARWINLITSLERLLTPMLRVGVKLIPQSWIVAFVFSLGSIGFAWAITLSKTSNIFNKEVTG